MKTKQLIKKRYEITELEHRETLSDTYFGLDTITHKPVKIIQYDSSVLNASMLETVLNIANRLHQVRSPFISNLLDYQFDGKTFSTIYQFEDTIPLSTYLQEVRGQNLKVLWKIATQIMKAIYALHSANLFHGMLNFLTIGLREDHSILVSKSCIDAMLLKHNIGNLEGIEEGAFLSPDYFYNEPLDNRTDIYTYGIILYVFFSQKWPFPFTNKINKIKQNFKGKPDPFEKVDARIPDKLEHVIHKAIAINKSERFQTFDNLIAIYRSSKSNGSWGMNTESSDSEIKNNFSENYTNKAGVKRRITQLLLIIFMAIMGGIVYLIMSMYYATPPSIIIPNIVGINVQDGMSSLKSSGLKGAILRHRVHPIIEEGHIIETKPAQGREVKLNREIQLIVSKGMPRVNVPNLVGKEINQVFFTYKNDNLSITVDNKIYSLTLPKNYVVSQSHEVNASISATENLKVTISKGFPIDVSVSANLQSPADVILAKVGVQILPEWPKQNISVFYTQNNDRQKLYSDFHDPDESIDLEFRLKAQGVMEVYFNEELGYKSQLK